MWAAGYRELPQHTLDDLVQRVLSGWDPFDLSANDESSYDAAVGAVEPLEADDDAPLTIGVPLSEQAGCEFPAPWTGSDLRDEALVSGDQVASLSDGITAASSDARAAFEPSLVSAIGANDDAPATNWVPLSEDRFRVAVRDPAPWTGPALRDEAPASSQAGSSGS